MAWTVLSWFLSTNLLQTCYLWDNIVSFFIEIAQESVIGLLHSQLFLLHSVCCM